MNYYFSVLSDYANFSGRARRQEYWMFYLFNTIANVSLVLIGNLLNFEYLNIIYSLFVMIPTVAVTVRRMHDVGKSGWYMLIPIYNLILTVTEGDQGDNEYGPDPKDPYSGMESQIEDIGQEA